MVALALFWPQWMGSQASIWPRAGWHSVPCCQQVSWASGRLPWESTPGVLGAVSPASGVHHAWDRMARGQVVWRRSSESVVCRMAVCTSGLLSELPQLFTGLPHRMGPSFPWLGEQQVHLPYQRIFTEDLLHAGPRRGAGDARRNRPCCLHVMLATSWGRGVGRGEPLRSPEARDHDHHCSSCGDFSHRLSNLLFNRKKTKNCKWVIGFPFFLYVCVCGRGSAKELARKNLDLLHLENGLLT